MSGGADISPDASAIDWDGTRPWSIDDLEPAVRETCDRLYNAIDARLTQTPALTSPGARQTMDGETRLIVAIGQAAIRECPDAAVADALQVVTEHVVTLAERLAVEREMGRAALDHLATVQRRTQREAA